MIRIAAYQHTCDGDVPVSTGKVVIGYTNPDGAVIWRYGDWNPIDRGNITIQYCPNCPAPLPAHESEIIVDWKVS